MEFSYFDGQIGNHQKKRDPKWNHEEQQVKDRMFDLDEEQNFECQLGQDRR
jgi:hypothetical protein